MSWKLQEHTHPIRCYHAIRSLSLRQLSEPYLAPGSGHDEANEKREALLRRLHGD